MKTAQEIKELQRQEYGAYKKAEEIVEKIEEQAKEKALVFKYTYPAPIVVLVKEILEEWGFKVVPKQDEITRQTVTEISWE